jgi:hypothetical protein
MRMGAVLPEDLELMAPGPQLFTLLAGVDRAGLSERDRVRLAQARHRLCSHLQGEFLVDLYAVRAGEPADEESLLRGGPAWPWAACEVAFALRWTQTAAAGRLELAHQLVDELPQVLAALRAGVLDMPKVLVICELAGWLEDRDTARRLVEAVIGRAPELTTGQIRARLRRLVLAVDPDAARRRCAQALKTRRVESFANPDGTGEVWGRNLAPQDAAAAWERLTAIARAAKAAGDDRSLDQLRADALLDLLVGEGIATGQPVTRHLAGLPDADGHSNDNAVPGAVRHNNGGADAPATETPASAPAGSGRWAGDPAVTAAAAAAGAAAGATGDPPGGQSARPAGALPAPRRGTIELLLPLSTATGQDDLPGEIAGWGPVIADIARDITTRHTAARWRYSTYNRLGELTHHGPLTTRRTPPPDTGRRPSAAVTDLITARNRTCTAPGCRIPARTCDLDHTTDWAHGGATHPDNLAPLCRRHHKYKHQSGATVWQLDPAGVYLWTTPAGMQYVTRPDPPLLDRHTPPGPAPPPP